jgi:hypothetical protein
VYFADPGNGSGIAAALAAAAIVPGDIWIRPGTYTKAVGQTRFVIPRRTRVWGAGEECTIIVGNATDNCIWECGDETELAWMTVRRPAAQGLVGTMVINATGNPTAIYHLQVDASLANPRGAGAMTAGILYSRGGAPFDFVWNVLNNVKITGPVIAPGAGEQDPLLMFACVRGEPAGDGTIALVNINVAECFDGDAGLVSIGDTVGPQQGCSFTCGRLLVTRPRTVGIYADFAPFFTNGGQSVVLMEADDSSVQTGIWLRNAFQYELGSTLVINISGPGIKPAVIVDSPAGAPAGVPSRCNVHECTFIGWGGDDDGTPIPVVIFGQGADLIVGAKMVNCNVDSFGAWPPIRLGVGCSNSIVSLNVGSGGGVPDVLGVGNELAHNIWA